MSSRIFGWSYPPGCSGPPDDYEPVVLRCRKCGCFLPGVPVRSEPWESSYQCDGKVDSDGWSGCGCVVEEHAPHKVVMDAGQYDVYECSHCHLMNEI